MAPSSSASPAAGLSRPVAQRKVHPSADYRRRPRMSVSPPPKKFRSMVEIMKVATRVELPEESEESEEEDDYEEVVCEQCGSGERPDELLLCDECNKGFHMLCLSPIVVRVPMKLWHCPHCSADQHRVIKSMEEHKEMNF